MPKRYIRINNRIAKLLLAATDLPSNGAPVPDEYPAEIYKKCGALHETLAELFTGTLGKDFAPITARSFHIENKAGKAGKTLVDAKTWDPLPCWVP